MIFFLILFYPLIAVLDRTKFTTTKFVEGEMAVRKLANQTRFKSEKSIGANLYEVQLGRHTIRIDLPMQIGLNILFNAKLIIAKFAFNFVDYFIHR